jgi:hypothetical protein
LWTFQIEMKGTGLSSVSQNEHVGFCSSPACVAPFYSEVPSPKLTPLFLAGSRAVDITTSNCWMGPSLPPQCSGISSGLRHFSQLQKEKLVVAGLQMTFLR